MIVYRLCDSIEIEKIMAFQNFKIVGKQYKDDPKKSTHKYVEGKNYMHFFENEIDLLYLSPEMGKNICVYDIPNDILENSKGYGNYADFINISKIQRIPEYAIPSEAINMNYIKKIYLITRDMDFDYFPNQDELEDYMSCMVDLTKQRNKTIDDGEER